MASMIEFSLPTILETQLTGLIGSGARTIRGAVWVATCEAGKPVSLTRNGVSVSWADATNEARRFANSVARTISANVVG